MKNFFLLPVLLLTVVFCTKTEEPVEEVPTDEIAIISTDFGDMYVVLYDETPLHKENFLKLAKEGFYDSTTFHRVITEFMIQGGDPNSKDDNPQNDGQGSPGYTINAEFSDRFIHKKGALSAARMGDRQNPEKKSNGSQFYVVHGKIVPEQEVNQVLDNINNTLRQNMMRDYIQAPENKSVLDALQRNQNAQRLDSVESILLEVESIATEGFTPKVYTEEQLEIYSTIGGTAFLDNNYTVFGEVVKGLDIIDSIAVVPTGPADRPLKDVIMKVRVEEMERSKVTAEFGYTYH